MVQHLGKTDFKQNKNLRTPEALKLTKQYRLLSHRKTNKVFTCLAQTVDAINYQLFQEKVNDCASVARVPVNKCLTLYYVISPTNYSYIR